MNCSRSPCGYPPQIYPQKQRSPRIGKKTAERIIVELHDKLGQFAAYDDEDAEDDFAAEPTGETDEIVQALVGLGYTQAEVLPVVKRLDLSQPIEVLIKQALREFMKG